ncbi:hypothetical protein CR513_20417, partial [Mucuna pruriens]
MGRPTAIKSCPLALRTQEPPTNISCVRDDMVVKLPNLKKHIKDLEEIFAQVQKYDMRLNPNKCVFRV